jgi:hypothetical protein
MENKTFEHIFEKTNRKPLREMALVSGRDEGNMIVFIGSDEHNPPHAHITSLDKSFKSRFIIKDKTIPTDPNSLQIVGGKDMELTPKIRKWIIDWAGKQSKENKEYTHWDYARHLWKRVEEFVNEDLLNPEFLDVD